MGKTKDVLNVVISDMHSGSNYALFLDREWQGKDNSHVPRSGQIKIRERFEKFAEEIRLARKGKQIKLVHNGDAIDGDHHHSGDVCTINPIEQADIHIEIVNDFQKRIGWQAGDEMYYTRGTKVHVENFENYIGRELNAVPCGDFYAWDFLELEINGTVSWFVHHGPGRGEGPNEGNAMRNWLRCIQQEAVKDDRKIPDVVWTGHVHYPTYSSYVWRDKMNFKTVHGIITPSWQLKTSYGWMRAAVQTGKIGGVSLEIKADGTICIPKFSVMESRG
jgi:hypothetical protein